MKHLRSIYFLSIVIVQIIFMQNISEAGWSQADWNKMLKYFNNVGECLENNDNKFPHWDSWSNATLISKGGISLINFNESGKITDNRFTKKIYVSPDSIIYIFDKEVEINNSGDIIYKRWNELLNSFIYYMGYFIEYDSNNKIVSGTRKEWINTGEWKDYYRISYKYENNSTEWIEQLFNFTYKNWNNYNKSNFTVDNNGNKILENIYNWALDSNRWEQNSKIESYYTTTNNISYQLIYDCNNNQFTYKDSIVYIYNTFNMMIEKIIYKWNADQFVKSASTEINYNVSNNVTSIHDYIYNGAQLTEVNKKLFEYDMHGNPLTYIDLNSINIDTFNIRFETSNEIISKYSLKSKDNPYRYSFNNSIIQFKDKNLKLKHISLYNPLGRMTTKILQTGKGNQFKLKIMSPGMYVMTVNTDNREVPVGKITIH